MLVFRLTPLLNMYNAGLQWQTLVLGIYVRKWYFWAFWGKQPSPKDKDEHILNLKCPNKLENA
ncbi:hypothetical protein HUJ04_000924 [Dendroctonus ponderosae]|nr:hypothetical protein HUJ04_000924 [Dendroctonus ponderosae]